MRYLILAMAISCSCYAMETKQPEKESPVSEAQLKTLSDNDKKIQEQKRNILRSSLSLPIKQAKHQYDPRINPKEEIL